MQKCPHCSAPLADHLEECTFCHTTTESGAKARRARAAQEDADRRAGDERAIVEAAAAKQRAQAEVDAAGKWAVISPIVGTVLCCVLPVGPVLGVVFGLRARRLSEQHGLTGTTAGTAGLWLGGLGLAISVAMWILVGVMMVKENQRKDELRGQLQNVAAQELDLKTACALVELDLFDSDFGGFSSLEDFICLTSGEVVQDGDTALLRDAHISKSGSKVEVFGCLQFRQAWSVQQTRGDEDCAAPKPEKSNTAKQKRRRAKETSPEE